jgi:threonine/homoserine/homoserine lactone efflux protein
MLSLFIKGLIIGFAIAAPVGPIGVLCIQQSLHDGFKIGLMTGLGAAIADGTYGLVAGFGLTALSSLLITYQFWIRLFGGLFLLYLGIKLFFTPSREKSAGKSDRSSWHALGTTYLLTLTNPATILSFIAVFAGLGLGTIHPSYIDAIILVLGITIGSAIWWIILSSGVAFMLHHRLSVTMMQGINRLSGAIIFGFGLLALFMR